MLCQGRGDENVELPPQMTLNDLCPSPGLLASQNDAFGQSSFGDDCPREHKDCVIIGKTFTW